MKGRGGEEGRARGSVASGAGEATLDEFLTGASLDELREFLEADHFEVDADPEFKERLRRELWELVQMRVLEGGKGRPGSGS